jgi:MSHA biogenesis protein MshJ
MKHYWELVQSKVEAMPLRERVIMFAAIAFSIIALTSTMLLNPLFAKQKALSKKMEGQQAQIKELQAKVQSLSQAKKNDEDAPLRANIAKLKQQLESQQNTISKQQENLVDADKVVGLLEQVLNKNGKLQLVQLKNSVVSPVNNQAKNNAQGQKQIFKHSIEITLRGSYLDLLQYLAAVEKARMPLYWANVHFNVIKHPDAVLVLNLYTLSLDKTWLKI